MLKEKLMNRIDSLMTEKSSLAVIAIFGLCIVFAVWCMFAAFAGIWLGAVFVGNTYGISAVVVFITVLVITFRLEINGKSIYFLPKVVSSLINFAFGFMGSYLLLTTPYWGAFATFIVVSFWAVALIVRSIQVVKLFVR